MNLKTQLNLLLGGAVAALLCVGGMGVYNADTQSAFGERAHIATTALRAQMEADMKAIADGSR